MTTDYMQEYKRWLENLENPENSEVLISTEDRELLEELKSMDNAEIEDAFYRDLAFGTGGLRGTLGAGTNRMNVYVVAKASQGVAGYLLSKASRDAASHQPAKAPCDTASHQPAKAPCDTAGHQPATTSRDAVTHQPAKVPHDTVSSLPASPKSPSVVIGYDSRLKSDVFARTAAGVFAANGIRVHLWPYLNPVPTVSYAVRYLKADCGVMITASHNPSKYNGYKVYGPDGCQITNEAAEEILQEIRKTDIFTGVDHMLFVEGLASGQITNIDDAVMDAYIEEVKKCSVLFGEEIDRNVAIVYTPLNGTGLVPVTRVLEESGFSNITVVEEQRQPDGNFPTCPYPNPEIREAMELGLEYCKRTGADLLLATDPDADRCGIAVKEGDDYRLLSGNEVGLLLLDYICSQRTKHGEMPARPVFIKTIVTMDLAEKIAEHYGAETVNVLTGFKFIGEVIGRLEASGRESDYICGFEESYGYLTGTYVRDKDAVNAAFMISEMFAYYKTRGISLIDKLSELYAEYGFCFNTLHSCEFSGSAGMEKMTQIMAEFHKGLSEIGGKKVLKTLDYSKGLDGLPPSDVLKFYTETGSAVVRPSGTEPKLKLYISITAANRAAAETIENATRTDLERIITKHNQIKMKHNEQQN